MKESVIGMIISGVIELAKVLPRAIAKARGYRKKCENCGCDAKKGKNESDRYPEY